MNDYIIHRDDELKHFGTKGMHWGVRRYQNPDGTLTEAGRKRYKNAELNAQLKSIEQIRQSKKWQEKYKLDNYGSDKVQLEFASDFSDLYTKNLKKEMQNHDMKQAIKNGVAVTGTALAAIGGYYLYKTGKLDSKVFK